MDYAILQMVKLRHRPWLLLCSHIAKVLRAHCIFFLAYVSNLITFQVIIC